MRSALANKCAVIVIDDVSTDGSWALITQFPDVHAVQLETNGGVSMATLRGLEEARALGID